MFKKLSRCTYHLQYEATLVGLTHEVEIFYGTKKYQTIDTIIKQVLNESNKPNRCPTQLRQAKN